MMKPVLFLAAALAIAAGCQSEKNPEVSSPGIVISHDLSNQIVYAFEEDNQGHMWIGTFRGLNRFAANEYIQYFQNEDGTGLPDDEVYGVHNDQRGRLWVTTVNGICYLTDQDSFIQPKNGKQNLAKDIVESPDGRMFFNNQMQVMEYLPEQDSIRTDILYDPVQQTPSRLFFLPNGQMLLLSSKWIHFYDAKNFNLIYTLTPTRPASSWEMSADGKIWCSGSEGVFLFDPLNKVILEAPKALGKEPQLAATTRAILPYDDSLTLFVTNSGDLLAYDAFHDLVLHSDDNNFPFSHPTDPITGIYKDRNGDLWLRQGYLGYSILHNEKKGFNADNTLASRMKEYVISSVTTDHDGRLWISAANSPNVFMYDNKELKEFDIIHILSPEIKTSSGVFQLYVDEDDDIWVSYSSAGIRRFRYMNGTLVPAGKWSYRLVLTFADDGMGNVWAGGFNSPAVCIDKKTGTFRKLDLYPDGYMHVSAIKKTSAGLLAGAFPHDIRRIDPVSFTAAPFVSEATLKEVLTKGDYIPTCFYEDSQGIIWIGTNTNGLLCWYPDKRELRRVFGTPCDDISAVLEDKEGNIWVSTQYGLGKYDRVEQRFTNYTAEDGIGGNQFMDRAATILKDGTMVFGGTHGFTVVNPYSISRKKDIPLSFEYLKVNNTLVQPGPGAPVSKALMSGPEITLNHKLTGLSIAFAALDYSNGERSRYFYRLEGFDRYWVDAGASHEAYYANLSPGHYTFRVRIGSNSIAEKEIALPINVKPTPWLSKWAILAYILLITGAAWGLTSIWTHYRKEVAAARKAQREKEEQQRINRMNTSFFANMAHEFRTPLTLISGPVSLLSGSATASAEDKRMLRTVQKNVDRLLKLVNQLLDMGKLETDSLPLKVSKMDIVPLVKEQNDLFLSRAKSKNINFEFYCHENTYVMWADADKIGKIMGNLLSNAFKFTPEGGTVRVMLDVISREHVERTFPLTQNDTQENYLRVIVSDTGPGIPKASTEKIFERYYQVDGTSDGAYNYGTGIGLYYTRALVTLHHGYIHAGNREAGTGAVFTFILPTGEDAYALSERENSIVQVQSEAPAPVEEIPEVTAAAASGKSILVVDDDIEVTQYLKDLLSADYEVICKFNAASALESLGEKPVDLVISDVSMPGKDGYALCKDIKSDSQLCHIPVILVTAKVTVENQIQGLDMGADAYVTKPFDPYYLKSLIRSQLDNRDRMQRLVRSATSTEAIAPAASLSSQDSEFLDSLYRLMESEMANPELDVEKMAGDLFISRSKLFYKVKGLTGQTPIEFFKQYKLNRAAQLLKEGKYTISQISDLTGFSSPSKFSTLFKKQFGVPPSSYKG